MPRRTPSTLGTSELEATPGRDRGRCKLAHTDAFWKSAESLVGLGPNETMRRARAGAAVRAFFNTWQKKASATDEDLNRGRWKYKPLSGKRPRAVKLRQIYLTPEQGGIRVALVVEEGERCVMTAVLAYHKRDQDAEIERAAAIARAQRREET